jgi:hypothetical protein
MHVHPQLYVCASASIRMCIRSYMYVHPQLNVRASAALRMCIRSSMYVHPQLYVCASAAECTCIRSSTYVHPQLYVCASAAICMSAAIIRSYMISGYLLRSRSYIHVCNTGQRQSVHQVVRDIGISAAYRDMYI